MNLYQPTITGSLSVSGSVNISGSITIAGGGTISGTASIATTALTASFVENAQTASYVLNAVSSSFVLTASSADNFLVRNTLTAQTLVVQTITSSVDFVTGSTRFGSISANTHVFTGSVNITGSITSQGGFILGNSSAISPTGSIGYNNAIGVFIYGKSGSEADFRLYNRDGLTAMSVIAGTQNINFNGSVGIGTNSPSTTLHALGPIRSQDSRGGSLPAVEISGGNVSLFPYISVDQSNPMSFITAGQYRMLITGTTGNVLIGTTTDSGYKLDISGTTRVNGSLLTNTIRTTEGSTTANSGAYATLFTISGSKAVFQIFVQVPAGAGDAANYTVYAVVLYDGSAARIIANNGGVTDIILSGLNVQARQQSGNSQTIEWKYLRIQ